MNYLQNHCWCSDSNWGGIYHCRHVVDVPRNLKGECYHDGPHIDWIDMTTTKEYDVDDFGYEITKQLAILKPEVIEWLNENVKDRKDSDCVKGWAYGSDEYRSHDSSVSMSIFFHRRNDAMKFIKTFSVFRKPIHYLNYFKDDRKELNLDTLTYS